MDAADAESVNMTVDNVILETPNSYTNPLYQQCKNARRMSFVDRLISVTNDGTFGTIVTSPAQQIGHLTDHGGLEHTFHGSRIQKGNCTVNQSISLSFDPTNMSCLSCTTEHTQFFFSFICLLPFFRFRRYIIA